MCECMGAMELIVSDWKPQRKARIILKFVNKIGFDLLVFENGFFSSLKHLLVGYYFSWSGSSFGDRECVGK